ncbi:MAG TPA: hypothetical protein PK265_02490 [Candidatus Saccharibacteria bacterium]|nr:hypothetical protein [Candidatus Saccharibacteria bacterium]HRQ98167.1 hypothetical protein [Candidatus Saccharibacteria bacterium]
MKTITFDDTSKHIILQIFGKDIDDQGYIIDIMTNERVLSPEGEEVLAQDFAGIKKGSEIFITKDLPSLLQFANSAE